MIKDLITKDSYGNPKRRWVFIEPARVEKGLKDIWIEFSLKMCKELQKVRLGEFPEEKKYTSEAQELYCDGYNDAVDLSNKNLDNFWLTFCKEGAKVFGIKDCDDCEEKLKQLDN